MNTIETLTNKCNVSYYSGESHIYVSTNDQGFFDLNEAAAVLLWTIGADNIKLWLEKIDASARRTGKGLTDKKWNISFGGGRATLENGRFCNGRYKVSNGFGWSRYTTPLFTANGFEIGVDARHIEDLYFFLLTTADLDSIDTSKVADALTTPLQEDRVEGELAYRLKVAANRNRQWLAEMAERDALEVKMAAFKQDLEAEGLTEAGRDLIEAELKSVKGRRIYVGRSAEFSKLEIYGQVQKLIRKIDSLLKGGVSADIIKAQLDEVTETNYELPNSEELYGLLQEEEADDEEEGCELCGAPIADDDTPVNPDTGDYDGCVWCREDADAKAEAEQVERVKAVLKDLKHYGQARMAPGGDDYCEIVYGQHNTVLNSGGFPEVEPVAGHTIYVSSDHSTYGFDPFTIGQRKHSKLWRIVKVNADGTRTYHYTAKKWSAKAVLIATAAGLDADDLFKGDPCEMYGKMRDLMELIDTAKGGK